MKKLFSALMGVSCASALALALISAAPGNKSCNSVAPAKAAGAAASAATCNPAGASLAGFKSFGPQHWVAPQPVLIIGTYNKDGRPNAMTAAWAAQWSRSELMFSLGPRGTADNLDLKGEFTVAFATVPTAVAADYVGIVSSKDNPDKMASTGWKAYRAKNVDAPVFDAFPMTLECRLSKKFDSPDDASRHYIVAQIVNVLCDKKFLASDGNPDVEKLNLIAYDPVLSRYFSLGKRVGDAFKAGNALKPTTCIVK